MKRRPACGWVRVAGFGGGFLAGVLVSGALVLSLTCARKADTGGADKAGAGEQKSGETGAENLVVARVGRQKITPRDVDLKIRLSYAKEMSDLKGLSRVRQQHEILKAMVDQYAWVEAGERHGFTKDQDFKDALELSRKYILANHTVERMVYDKSQPTEQEIQTYYNDNIDQFHEVARVEANLILLKDLSTAQEVRRRAIAGEDWNALTRRYTTYEPTRDTGGDVGIVSHRSAVKGFGDQPTPLNERIMALAVNEISQPIQTDQGWVVAKVRRRIEENTQALADVHDAIQKRLASKRANELFSGILADVKKNYGASIDEDAWTRYAISVLSEDDVMEMAQLEKNPRARVDIYEAFVEHVPGSQRAPQALFMAGYTYADDLHDYGKAREVFQKVIDRYPQSELVSSARWMMDNMEKGLENLPYASQIKRKVTGG